MTVPSAPFCLSSNVAPYMSLRMNNRGDFEDGVTNMSKTTVDGFIDDVSAQILGRFRLAGYTVPLTDLTGITWPSTQTDFLRALCVMGACSVLSSLFVANPGRRSADGNPFEKLYNSGLEDIFRTAFSIRIAGPFYGAQYKSMSPAEKAVGVPAVPTTSHLLTMNDPAAHTGFRYWTDKSQEMQDYMEALLPLHNYDYDLNEQEAGPGYV